MARWGYHRNECEREGAEDFDRYGRPDYERDRWRESDRCYFEGYDSAEREESRRRDERREEEAAEARAAQRRAEARRDEQAEQEAIEEQQRQEYYAMRDQAEEGGQ